VTSHEDKAPKATQPLIGLSSTFMGVPRCEDFGASDAEVVLTGVPFDLATTGRAGARSGPTGIRLASTHLTWEENRWPWGFSLPDLLKVEDYGDLPFSSGDPSSMVENLTTHAHDVLKQGKMMLTLGGDHFITLPLIRAHAQQHGPLALIHFDSHTDNYAQGGPFDHGIMLREAHREETIDPTQTVQIGIRTEYKPNDHPYTVLDAAWCNDNGPEAIGARIREIVGDSPTYLTLDIDCLDPAYAPGTGTPVVGGLTTDIMLKILRRLVGANIVGMDVVEVAPPFDHAEITSLAAATLTLELLHVVAAGKMDPGSGARASG